MDVAHRVIQTQAVYREGTLQLLEPLDLPEGTEVQVAVQVSQPDPARIIEAAPPGSEYPTVFLPVERLRGLVGLITLGGDALADSEAP